MPGAVRRGVTEWRSGHHKESSGECSCRLTKTLLGDHRDLGRRFTQRILLVCQGLIQLHVVGDHALHGKILLAILADVTRARCTMSSTEWQMYPDTPSRTTSSTAPPGSASTGVPHAIASIITS